MLFLLKAKDFVFLHWKKLGLLALLLLPLGTYQLGHYKGVHSLPSKIEQTVKQTEDKKTEIVTQQKSDVQVQQQQDTSSAAKAIAVTDVTKTKTTVTKKDGTVIVKETEHDHIGTKAETKSSSENKSNSEAKSEASTVTKVEDHIVTQIQTKIEYSNPTWNMSLLLTTVPVNLLNTGELRVGGHIQHRLFDSIFVGALILVPPSNLKETQVGISIGLLTQ